MSTPYLHSAQWFKSSYSGTDANCVEAAVLKGTGLAVRDSKDPEGPALTFTSAAWRAFLIHVKQDDFFAA